MAPSSRSRSRSRSYSPSDNRRNHRKGSSENEEEKPGGPALPEQRADRSNVIAIFNLDTKTTNEDLIGIFSEYGTVTNSRLVMDQKRGKSRGFAFVSFQTEDMAENAKTQAHGKMIDEKEIRVDFSMTKKAHEPTPGVYLGHAHKEHLNKVLNQSPPPEPRLRPDQREKSISPDRPPVTHPYKGRSRTKSLSPDSLAKRTAKVRPASGGVGGGDNRRSRERDERKSGHSSSRGARKSRSRSPHSSSRPDHQHRHQQRQRYRSPPRSRRRSRDRRR